MKKWLAMLSLTAALGFAALPSMADDLAASALMASAPAALAAVAASGVADAAAPAASAVASAPAVTPTADKGDTTWMMISTILVIMMTIPGLALYYGGLVRAKNMLSVLMQIFTIFSVISLLWVIYGYSMAFTPGGSMNSFFGGLSKAFLHGVDGNALAETFSKGVYIPEIVFVAFQLTFAAITVGLIVGGFAERMKFSAVLVFSVLWFTFSYVPVAHMVWFWGGPSAYGDPAGFLFSKGALDFAGGTVVHINSGVAGLVGALVVGKRIGYGKETMMPHNLVMTMIGASLLWVGWFGFNAGSNLEATGTAGIALLNTIVATAAATVSWLGVEWLLRGKPSMLGGASGAVAGLVVVTPAAGFAGPMGAIVMGLIAGGVCFWSVSWLKHKLGYDDTLDVFGVHAIGGMLGAIGTGVFADPALGGSGVFDYAANKVAEYDMGAQLVSQLWGVGTTVVWTAVVSFVLFKLIDMVMGLRVSEDVEREGLDINEHGEQAYNK